MLTTKADEKEMLDGFFLSIDPQDALGEKNPRLGAREEGGPISQRMILELYLG